MKSLAASFALLLVAQSAAAMEQGGLEVKPPDAVGATAREAGSASPGPEAEHGYGKTQGLIPGVPLVFGPKISVALPHPSVGLELKLANLVGASFDYGFFPDITVSNVTVGIKGWHVDGRVYPFRGAFFLGAALGGRNFTGSYTDISTGVPLTGTVKVDATYIAPEIGWRWVYESGFLMGVELGWEFLLSYSRQTEVPLLFPADRLNDINKRADDIGQAGLPHVALFQIGYLF